MQPYQGLLAQPGIGLVTAKVKGNLALTLPVDGEGTQFSPPPQAGELEGSKAAHKRHSPATFDGGLMTTVWLME